MGSDLCFLPDPWRLNCKLRPRYLLLFAVLGLLLVLDTRTIPGCSISEGCGRLHRSDKVSYAKKHIELRPIRDETFQERSEYFKMKRTSDNSLENSDLRGKEIENSSLHENYSWSVPTKKTQWMNSKRKGLARPVVVQASVSFSDSVLLLLNPLLFVDADPHPGSFGAHLECLFAGKVRTKVISADQGFIRCQLPPTLGQRSLNGAEVTVEIDRQTQSSNAVYGKFFWKQLVYGLILLEEEDHALLFAKGIVTKKQRTPPKNLHCLFGNQVITEVVAFCQENIRCKLPPFRFRANLTGKTVTLLANGQSFPSIIRYYPHKTLGNFQLVPGRNLKERLEEQKKQHHVCACTMVWNGAKFLREWVIYHSQLGVQHFFVYDNNSEDDLQYVVDSLLSYNVTRHAWPWIKTQEAGFSHCSIRAAKECSWVLFIDLDEFVFPKRFMSTQSSESSTPNLHRLIRHYDPAGQLGQLKMPCYNFGPSSLTALPSSGQIVNYICRMKAQKRVKSIVRINAMDPTYCSRVHHFELRQGFDSALVLKEDAVIQHYKYSVWEDFRLKFFRRAATFVADWQEKGNMGSKDRTPGLSSEAREPPGWAQQFCEVEDTELRNYILKSPRFQNGSQLLWEQ
eukprot:c24726_g2_i2 orf=203-2074(-)